MTSAIKLRPATRRNLTTKQKTVAGAVFTDGGKTLNAAIPFEGKAGKVALMPEAVEMPHMKIQVVEDKFK